MHIERADFGDPALAEFLVAHRSDMAGTAPPESQHALDIRQLDSPGVRLWIARHDGVLVGTVALASDSPAHDELKSMRTDPSLRGKGIGAALLRHALADARARGVQRISLETGSQDYFAPARALYTKYGFTECGPFGTYVPDPHSTFMTLVL